MNYFLDIRFIICVVYFIIVNIIAFAAYGADKHKAKKGKWRISERELLLLAYIGGSIGALLGMKFFHHKTKKPAFAIGVPLILIFQIISLLVRFAVLRYIHVFIQNRQ